MKKETTINSKKIEVKPQDDSEYSFKPDNQPGNGESVKVALRLRPLNTLELNRGDENCFQIIDSQNCQLYQKKLARNFRFNYIISEKTSQQQVYETININEFLQSALSGYSVTVFAYGQTGSGKTYTMAGNQQRLSSLSNKLQLDQRDGIIPRAVRNLWRMMAKRQEKFALKASFSQIYNQQIKDLLNPNSGVLHCRWNSANGFFVEDLVIVDCTNLQDMMAVLNQGMKNRKSGSHELNKDSSRSHSLLTMYVISEIQNDGEIIKKYGKISFVDLAGSQRLKQSKSQGEMVKETGNINKSLFTLGKVIKGLSDKKSKTPYIPYRDSKLTMLLMDSLGGTSKALMIACVSPASAYIEETLSTLNYASRTMNIKNKPVVQMDQKDQVIFGLIRQRQLLKLENQYLRQQLQRANKGMKIQFPEFQDRKDLPPLVKDTKQASSRPLSLPKQKTKAESGQVEVSLNKVVQQYEYQLVRLNHQNQQLRNGREIAQKNYHIVVNDNNALQIKLDNLEELFIRSTGQRRTNINEQYMNSNLLAQNKLIKDKITQVQDQIFQMKQQLNRQTPSKQNNQLSQLRSLNRNLTQRLQFLQRRERDLLQNLQKKK